MITDLFSPGAQTSARAHLELRLDSAATTALRSFLAGVAHDALDRPASFTAGEVHGQWATTVVPAFVGVMAEFMGIPVQPHAALHDEHLRAMASRLAASPLPGEAYTSARAVLADGGGRTAMRTAMAIDSGETTLTAGLDVIGRTWATVVNGYARIEATIGFNTEVIKQALRIGVKQIVWISHHDSVVRASHLAADGQRAKPGGHYIVGGAVLRWPGDVAGPWAETAGCRCVLAAAGDRPPGYELPPRNAAPSEVIPAAKPKSKPKPNAAVKAKPPTKQKVAALPELSGRAAAEALAGPTLDSGPARRALMEYTTGLYGQINLAMRDGRALPEDMAHIPGLLTELADAHPLPFPVLLHRGVTDNQALPAVGDIVTDPAPLSGTLSERSARHFGSVIWSIHVPQGHPAIPVSQLQKGPHYVFEGPGIEDEIILPPGARLRILNVTTSTVEAEVIRP